MFSTKSLALVLLLVTCVHPDTFVPIQLRKSLDDSWMTILHEAVAKNAHRFNSTLTTPLTERFRDFKYLQYYAKLGIGNPEQNFDFTFNPIYRMILVPSIAHRKKCGGGFRAYDEPSSHTYQDIHESFTLNERFKLNTKVTKDTLHIGKVNVSDQSFGLITDGPCKKNLYDGVVGLGYSKNHLTLLDNMARLKIVNVSIAGLYLDSPEGYPEIVLFELLSMAHGRTIWGKKCLLRIDKEDDDKNLDYVKGIDPSFEEKLGNSCISDKPYTSKDRDKEEMRIQRRKT